MKKFTILFLYFICLLCISHSSLAQIVGTDAFLQGRYLEIGMCKNGALGSAGSAPAGYHPHTASTGTSSVLAEVYDIGHDGWTTGTPPYMGDYTYVGSPFEGWEIQVNGNRAQAYASPAYSFVPYATSGSCSMTGAISSYINTGTSTSAYWNGTFDDGSRHLAISMETRVDTSASWVVMTVKLHNTGTTTLNNVYYFRSCDPDIDETWPGGGFSTDNWVTYQNDTLHRVLVSATGASSSHPYLGLGTFDSRAVALVYNSWALTVSQDLAALWSRTYGPASYTVGYHDVGDIAIGLVYKVDSIIAGDSATLSYAYLFGDSTNINSAFGVSGGDSSNLDSFNVLKYNNCSGVHFTVYNKHYIPGLTVKTYFGDGSISITPTSAYYSFGRYINYATVSHFYSNSGVYTVKHVLYNGTVPLDSLTESCNYMLCNDIYAQFYYDANNNCVKDTAEPYVFQPVLIEIRRNGIPIDTISSTSGLYYPAYGSAGDIYALKVLSVPAGLHVSCPSTGIVIDTLSATTTTSNFQFGLVCDSMSGYDLQVFASFRAGIHHFGGSIIADNTMCPLEPGTLTMQLSPKYAFQSSSPAIFSIAAQTFTWHLNLSGTPHSPTVVSVDCEKPTGTFLSIGDTVNSSYTIDPVSGDLHPADNICIRVDTVKGGYDPNYIDVSPSGYISAGTNLTYSIGFENTGNDTAHNIYIMDTLSDYLDASSFRMIAASAYMDITKIRSGRHTIFKFAFPNIQLPDSSHHNQCTGLLIYSVNSLRGLAGGTVIPAHAGIYFDDNPVVNTDTAVDIIRSPFALNVPGSSPAGINPNYALENE